jgi:hypothetical protein
VAARLAGTKVQFLLARQQTEEGRLGIRLVHREPLQEPQHREIADPADVVNQVPGNERIGFTRYRERGEPSLRPPDLLLESS